jgi:hypothetical protein
LGLSVIVFPGKVKQHITDLSRKNGAKYRPLAQVSSRYRFQIDPRMVRLSADGRSMGFFSGAPRLNNGEYRPLAQGLHDLKARDTGIPTSRASLKRVEKDQFRSEGAVMGARGGAGRRGTARGRPHRRQKQSHRSRNVGEQPRNTDLSRKNAQKVDLKYRPLTQVIPTPGAKNSDPRSKGIPTSDT